LFGDPNLEDYGNLIDFEHDGFESRNESAKPTAESSLGWSAAEPGDHDPKKNKAREAGDRR
jgi:hypothetical protein